MANAGARAYTMVWSEVPSGVERLSLWLVAVGRSPVKLTTFQLWGVQRKKQICLIFARGSIYAKRAYAIAIPSVCPSVTRVDQSVQ